MPAPVFIIAFANNAADRDRHLPALDAEFQRLHTVLGDASAEKRWELVPSAETSIKSFLDLLQAETYQNRIALLHFAGHADGQSLLMESAAGAPEIASAAGIAEFLAQHEGLGFLFLNACSTVGQVQALLAAGVPAIIATEHDINDAVATEFSSRFYKEFVNGQTLRKAFDAASAAVKTNMTLKTAAQTRSIQGVGVKRDPDDWPWKLHVRDGNKNADQWSLGVALDDPLWGVPEPEERPLPDVPFRHLLPFTAEHSAIFFGRRRETREVYDAIERGDSRRVVLLHGVSGAGKSSLLDAGLLPRLQRTREVVYLRRNPAQTLLGNVRTAVGLSETAAAGAAAGELADAWKRRETPERPLTVILDQVEEALSDSRRNGKQELTDLVGALKQIFDQPAPPLGSIVLGFRKEWLAEVESQLDTAKLASTAVFLDRLGTRGIIEAVEGVTRDAKLRARYTLTIPAEDAGLAGEIAGDLVTDSTSAIGPTLQVLLTKMWERSAQASGGRTFTSALYRDLVKEGALLKDFVDQQLDAMRGTMPAAADSGLVLDVLAFHTSTLGDATRIRSSADRVARYPAALLADVGRIIELASAGRLMAFEPDAAGAPGAMGPTRLGHDTLAPYIRRLATRSAKPVQRALRVLEERATEWADADGARRPLDAADLKTVESGLSALRIVTAPEQALLAASRLEVGRAARIRRQIRAGFAAAAVVVAAVGVVAGAQGRRATAQAHRAEVSAQVNASTLQPDPLDGALMLARLAAEPDEPPGAVQAALTVLAKPIPVALLIGHTDMIGSAEFSADGELIVTSSADSTARVWRRDGTKPPVVLRGHTAPIRGASFSPDGKLVVTASDDSTARVWHSDGTGAPVVLRHGGALNTATFSPDGRWIATASTDSVARVWRTDGTGAPIVLRGHTGDVVSAAFSRDGSHVVAASNDRTARVWRSDGAGSAVVLRGHHGVVSVALFSPDGKRIITGSEDATARVWRSDGTRPPVVLNGHTGAILGVTFSPDGELVATASADNDVRVWRSDGTGTPQGMRSHASQVYTVAFSADGRRVISGSLDGTARVTTVDGAGEPAVLSGHSGAVRSAVFSRDDRWILTAGNDGTARLWHGEPAGAAVVLHADDRIVYDARFSADGARVVTASDSVARLWVSDGSGQPVVRSGLMGHVLAVGFSGESARIVVVSGDGTARVEGFGGANTGVALKGQGQSVIAAALSPDGRFVASASADGTARVRHSDGTGATVVLRGHDGVVLSVAFSADGKRVVTTSDDNTARVWNADGTGTPVVLRGHRESVLRASFSRDGAWVLTASEDATARIWPSDGTGDAEIIRGHTGAVNSAELSPDGRWVLTASADGTARITRRDGTRPPIVIRGHDGPVSTATFSPDGARVVTTGYDGSTRILPVTWPVLLAKLEAATIRTRSAASRR